MRKTVSFLILLPVMMLLAKILPAGHKQAVLAQELETPTPEQLTVEPSTPSPPSPADVINAVNNLRLARGLHALSVHSVLMEVAAQQASALAASEGAIGHERPCGMTLGQQLLVLGFPLWGDLSQDGYRSENWVTASTTEDAISFWLGDDAHTNTMLSEYRSDIGAAVAVSDQIYIVLETALRTNTGQMQAPAIPILTGVPLTQTACNGYGSSSDISQYSIPVVISTARPDGDVVHEVQYGQTLWSLAIEYKVSIEQIKRLNGLTGDTIAPGWKLLIQKAATQPAPETATPLAVNTTQFGHPTPMPYVTVTPTISPTATSTSVSQLIKENSTVVAALLISFSLLVAGMIGFGKKEE